MRCKGTEIDVDWKKKKKWNYEKSDFSFAVAMFPSMRAIISHFARFSPIRDIIFAKKSISGDPFRFSTLSALIRMGDFFLFLQKDLSYIYKKITARIVPRVSLLHKRVNRGIIRLPRYISTRDYVLVWLLLFPVQITTTRFHVCITIRTRRKEQCSLLLLFFPFFLFFFHRIVHYFGN